MGDRFQRMMDRKDYNRLRMASGPDSMEVRRALLARVDAGEISMEAAQKEIRRLGKLPWTPGHA